MMSKPTEDEEDAGLDHDGAVSLKKWSSYCHCITKSGQTAQEVKIN